MTMAFVQIIEFTTTRSDELGELFNEWEADGQKSEVVGRLLLTADRDRPNTYLTIVEFESYEAAMANSARPSTGEFAAKMMAMCDGEPVFRNLDVTTQWPST